MHARGSGAGSSSPRHDACVRACVCCVVAAGEGDEGEVGIVRGKWGRGVARFRSPQGAIGTGWAGLVGPEASWAVAQWGGGFFPFFFCFLFFFFLFYFFSVFFFFCFIKYKSCILNSNTNYTSATKRFNPQII